MLKSLIFVCLFSISLHSFACDILFSDNQVCFDLEWIQKPVANKNSPFTLTTKPISNKNQSYTQIQVELWMPDMDHGSRPVKITEKENGVYLIENVYFIMRGNWEIKIKLLNHEQRVIEENKFEIKI